MAETEAKLKILNLLSEGKISASEAERLINAVTNDSPKQHKTEIPFPIISTIEIAKVTNKVKNLAKEVKGKVEETIQKAEPKTQELKNNLIDFGNWIEAAIDSIVEDINKPKK